jgi:hypothetical protein
VPDRLPSLVSLVAFWVPPALVGWAAAGHLLTTGKLHRTTITRVTLAVIVVGYAVAWFFYSLRRMPPYIPGAVTDPAVSTPESTTWLAVLTAALILPGSAVACGLAFRRRMRRGVESLAR